MGEDEVDKWIEHPEVEGCEEERAEGGEEVVEEDDEQLEE